MMALPNSRFGEMLRRNLQRKGNNWDMSSHEAGAATALSLAPFRSTSDSYSDAFQVISFRSSGYFQILNLAIMEVC